MLCAPLWRRHYSTSWTDCRRRQQSFATIRWTKEAELKATIEILVQLAVLFAVVAASEWYMQKVLEPPESKKRRTYSQRPLD